MLSLFFAPFAKFVKLDFFGNQLFVFTGPIIYALAGSTGELDESVL